MLKGSEDLSIAGAFRPRVQLARLAQHHAIQSSRQISRFAIDVAVCFMLCAILELHGMPMRPPIPFLLLALAAPVVAGTRPDSFTRALLRIGEIDQAQMNSINPSNRVLRSNVSELKQLVSIHGWPKQSHVGVEAATAAFLVSQHADFDPDFQKEALRNIALLASQGEAKLQHVAYLTDRIAVNEGRLQTYGTQGFCKNDRWTPKPIADADDVESRRSTFGLESLEHYIALGSAMFCTSNENDPANNSRKQTGPSHRD